jgi:hypothetical protein
MNTILGATVIGSGGGLIGLLISLVIAALGFWLIWYVITWMKIPEPGATIVRVVVGLIAILYLLRVFGIY